VIRFAAGSTRLEHRETGRSFEPIVRSTRLAWARGQCRGWGARRGPGSRFSRGLHVPPGSPLPREKWSLRAAARTLGIETAKALGLTIPPSLLLRADREIE
jgi:hypothetical protein